MLVPEDKIFLQPFTVTKGYKLLNGKGVGMIVLSIVTWDHKVNEDKGSVSSCICVFT